MTTRIRATLALLAALTPALAAAQTPPVVPDTFLHGVPAGTRQDATLTLSLTDAVGKGLASNLAALEQEQRVSSAEGARWKALSAMLPSLSGHVTGIREEISPAAFGFTALPGLELPPVIGPFNVFDARVAVSAPLLDLSAAADVRKQTALIHAEEHTLKNARQLVILAVANLYMLAVADASRVETSRSEVATADALLTLAVDQQKAGVAAGIDVLRQRVQLDAAKQRVIGAENDLAKQKLRLARAIGLPPGQAFDLSDRLAFAAAPVIDAATAVALAYAQREDVRSAEARVQAANEDAAAARGTGLPSLRVDGDYGVIGTSPSDSNRTFTVVANVRVPIFDGGLTKGKVMQANADRKQRQAELDDLKAGIYYEVQSAFLDLHAAESAVTVATEARGLADQQLTQTRDRFAAGVGTTLEVSQAQDALAAASDRYTTALYSHLIAKAALARALGVTEQGFAPFLGGR